MHLQSTCNANSLLLQDIKDIYIISLYIPLHYIKIGINFKEFVFFLPKYLHGLRICRNFASRYILKGGETAKQSVSGIFLCRIGKHIGIVLPWKSVMEILPFRCNATGKAMPFFYRLKQKKRMVD